MNTASSVLSLYRDLAVLLGVVIVALTLNALARSVLRRPGAERERGWRILLSRISLPVFLLGAVWGARAVFRVSETAGSILDAAFLFFVIVLLIGLVDGSVLAWYTGRQKPYPLPDVLRGLLIGVIYIGVLFAILKSVLHYDIKPLLTGSAILTAVLGLAFQGVLSNILSGMSLHFTRSFGRGDWVGVGPHEGVVVDTNWRETRIMDRNSNIVILPNNVVAGERIVNFSKPDHRSALVLTLKVSPVAPAAGVLAALNEAAAESPQVISEPKPKVYLTSYDETGVSYSLKFWIQDFAQKFTILTDVGRLAWYKLRRRGIQVAVSWPDRVDDLAGAVASLKNLPGGGQGGADGPAPAGDRTADVLLSSSFLRYPEGEKAGRLMVPEEELRALAARVKRSFYTRGEKLFRQGDQGTSCYVVVRGRIHGEMVYEEDGMRFSREFDVDEGGLFGEMSLFTGLPRTASGTVAKESEILEIQAQDFAALLARYPELAEAVAEMVSARNTQNKDFLLKLKELSAQQVEESASRHSVLAYLKKFVGAFFH